MLEALELNARRRRECFAEAEAGGAAYLVECRDLWDAFERDGGVYFEACADAVEVDALIAAFDGQGWSAILGIYNLRHPLDGQGAGLDVEGWRRGGRLGPV